MLETPRSLSEYILIIFPRSSTHAKVVFREVMHSIELDFGKNPETSEENLPEQSEEPTANLT